jgi:ribonuclease BN (tRNA processing enzyme)
MSVSRIDRAVFGGATSCYMVRAGETTIFLDAGSGLLAAPADYPTPPHILLSHLHLDHLIGLGMFGRLSQIGEETVIHVPTSGREDPKALLDRLYGPPYWPVNLSGYTGKIRILPLSLPLRIGEVLIEGIHGSHPGDSVLMKLSFRGKSLVYATDYEHEEKSFDMLRELARGTDLLLYDGQYSQEEEKKRKGFGHSTPERGLALMESCGAKRLWLIHHDPRKSDAQLLAEEMRIGRENVRFAREGEEIAL